MNKTLKQFNRKVECFYGEVDDVFDSIGKQCVVNEVFSYQESGTLKTWERDKLVDKYCQQHFIKTAPIN